MSRTLLAVIATLCGVAGAAEAELVLLGGIKDGIGSSPDPASPSVDLAAALLLNGVGSSELEGFDEGAGGPELDQYLAHTFDLGGTTAPIAFATLEYAVAWGTGGGAVGGISDGIALGFATPSSASFKAAIAWKRTYHDCPQPIHCPLTVI